MGVTAMPHPRCRAITAAVKTAAIAAALTAVTGHAGRSGDSSELCSTADASR
jgi:hypothetical protein